MIKLFAEKYLKEFKNINSIYSLTLFISNNWSNITNSPKCNHYESAKDLPIVIFNLIVYLNYYVDDFFREWDHIQLNN